MDPQFRLRKAVPEDIPAMEALIARSAREVGTQDYTPAQTEAAVAHVYGVDTELIRDGTYFVVTIGDEIAGCGGWSRRRTLFGGDHASARPTESGLLDPMVDPAKIRAFFVDPRFVRRGIGAALVEECERAALDAGFRTLELMATRTGEKLYAECGYAVVERTAISLPGAVAFPLARMKKSFASDQ
jgi:GNAT superfamily N-acetyltransferase